MVTECVTAVDAITGTVLVVDFTILRLSTPLLVVNILFVLVAFIVAVLENVQDATDVLLTSTDITCPTSVPLAVQEVVQQTTGLNLATQHSRDVVFNQVHGVETLQWVIMLSTLQKWMVGIVTVTTTKVFQLVLLSLEPWAFPIQLESVGFVAVAGLFHMDTVVRVLSLTSVVVPVVDKVA